MHALAAKKKQRKDKRSGKQDLHANVKDTIRPRRAGKIGDELKRRFKKLQTLMSFLKSNLPSKFVLMQESDSEDLKRILLTTLVAYQPESIKRTAKPGLQNSNTGFSLKMIINRVVEESIKEKRQNCLSLGFQPLDDNERLTQHTDIPGVGCRYVNTVMEYLKGSAWQTLHGRIGDGLMKTLLQNTCMFVWVNDDSYVQISGDVVWNIPVAKDSPYCNFNSDVKPSTSRTGSWSHVKGHHFLSRSRIFFKAKFSKYPGFPKSHVLNILHPSKIKPMSKYRSRCIARKLMNHIFLPPPNPKRNPATKRRAPAHEEALEHPKFSKTMRTSTSHRVNNSNGNHGGYEHHASSAPMLVRSASVHEGRAPSPLPLPLPAAATSLPVLLRRNSSSTSKMSTSVPLPANTINPLSYQFKQLPRGLVRGLPLFEQILKRHVQCPFGIILNRCCPASSGYLMDTPYQTLLSNQVHPHNVIRFVVKILDRLLPVQLLGDHNVSCLHRAVAKFITLGRHEQYSLEQIIQGMKPSKVKWLNGKYPKKKKKPSVNGPKKPNAAVIMTQADENDNENDNNNNNDDDDDGNEKKQKKKHLPPKVPHKSPQQSLAIGGRFKTLIFWIFNSLVIPLIRSNFYVTESEHLRQQTLYFRKQTWAQIQQLMIPTIKAQMYEKITKSTAAEVFKGRLQPICDIRLLPRLRTARPIANLSRTLCSPLPSIFAQFSSQKPWAKTQSVNSWMSNVFSVLSYEVKKKPWLLGASTHGHYQVYSTYMPFVRRWRAAGQPKLYISSVDVNKCFDNIEQPNLLHVIQDALWEDEYMILRYVVLTAKSGTCRFERKVLTISESQHFMGIAKEESSKWKHAVMADQVEHRFYSKEDILDILRRHLTQNVVRIDSVVCRQKKGIPQGSKLSSLLCSFAFGHLERTIIHPKLNKSIEALNDQHEHPAPPPLNLNMRWVDDSLFFSTSLHQAKLFTRCLAEGYPTYGIKLNLDKTSTNFPINVQGRSLRRFDTEGVGGKLRWCGYIICPQTLQVTYDYGRYSMKPLRYALTVEQCRTPGQKLQKSLQSMLASRYAPLLFDSTVNTDETIHFNLYQIFMLGAMKFHCILRCIGGHDYHNQGFLTKAITETISTVISLFINRQNSGPLVSLGFTTSITKIEGICIGWHAFYTVLLKKASLYPEVLKSIKASLSQTPHKFYKAKLKKTAAAAWTAEMSNILY